MKIFFSDYVSSAGVATDLVITAPVARGGSGESLCEPADLAGFLAEHDVRPDALADGGEPTEADLESVRMLRRETRAVLEATSEDAAVEGARVLVMRAGTGPGLGRDVGGRWQWYAETAAAVPLADELAVLIGVGLLGVMRTLSRDRFRQCASPVCDGVFVDTSRAGRRRYCMPDVCGNRLNVANYRARRRAGSKDPEA